MCSQACKREITNNNNNKSTQANAVAAELKRELAELLEQITAVGNGGELSSSRVYWADSMLTGKCCELRVQ